MKGSNDVPAETGRAGRADEETPAGLLTGLVPALRGSGTSMASVLRAGGSGSLGGGPAPGPRVLVVAEVALAVVLLTAAGLFLRSLDRLGRVDPGFAPEGVAVGLLASLATTRLLAGLLFGVEPWDPLTLGAVPLILLGVALLACWLPARQATRVDPVRALQDA